MRSIVFVILTFFIFANGVSQEAVLSGKIGSRTLDAMGGGAQTVDFPAPFEPVMIYR